MAITMIRKNPDFARRWDENIFNRLKWAEVIRVDPEAIVPPFDESLVDRAIRHYMAHGTPWLPLADPPEEYDEVWAANPTEGGYTFERVPKDGGDPWEPLEEWLGDVSTAAEEILTGKREWSRDIDIDSLDELLEDAIEQLCDAEEDDVRPPEIIELWKDLKFEAKLRWAVRHYSRHPDRIPDFWEHITVGWLASQLPSDLHPTAGPAQDLGFGFFLDLPVGFVQTVADGGVHGDAMYAEIYPEVALTFFQIWLDEEGFSVRIEL